jgi:hypothetical protein
MPAERARQAGDVVLTETRSAEYEFYRVETLAVSRQARTVVPINPESFSSQSDAVAEAYRRVEGTDRKVWRVTEEPDS